jgi:hypothetical protein
MSKKLTCLIGLIILGLILNWNIFHTIGPNELLFIHDEYFPIGKQELKNQFQIYDLVDFGSSNTFQLFVTYIDRIYYQIINYITSSLLLQQIFLYQIKLIIILVLPYIGFYNIRNAINSNADDYSLLLISLWYSFNNYTVIWWHGNAFSLSILICYSLAPYALSLWMENIFVKTGIKITNYMIMALIFLLMSFALYIFIPFILLIIIYTLTELHYKLTIKNTLKKILIAVSFLVPLFLIFISVAIELFYISTDAVNASGGATYGNMRGGIYYVMLMWYTWPLYTIWHPRNIYTFSEYYSSFISIIAPFSIYIAIIYKFVFNKTNLSFAICLLVFILLTQGAQGFMGGAFRYAVENIPGFRAFRSPDTKIAYLIILCLCCLFVSLASSFNKKFFTGLMVSIILIQGMPFFSKVALYGVNSSESIDRIITIPDDYKKVANFINGLSDFGYVWIEPKLTNGSYELSKDNYHAGQDIFKKLIKFPSIELSEYSGISNEKYKLLSGILENQTYSKISDYPVGYFIIRNDVNNYNESKLVSFIQKNSKLIYKNKTFELYKNLYGVDLIENLNKKSKKVQYIFKENTRIQIEERVTRFNFNLNYSKFWIGVKTESLNDMRTLEGLKILYHYSIKDKTEIAFPIKNSFANMSFSIDKSFNRITLLYIPQLIFNILIELMLSLIALYLGYIFFKKKHFK